MPHEMPSTSATFRPLLADRVCSACGHPSTFALPAHVGLTTDPVSACCGAPERELRRGGANDEEG